MKMDAHRPTGKAKPSTETISDNEAEQAVLGTILIDPETFKQVSGLLRPTDFVDIAHRTIYAVAMRLGNRGNPIDPITLLAELRPIPTQGEPWVSLLGSLARRVPHASHSMHYARIVWHASKRRQLLIVLEHCQEQLAQGMQAEEVITILRADLEAIEGTDAQEITQPNHQ